MIEYFGLYDKFREQMVSLVYEKDEMAITKAY
jgi:hypothetical protein